ncbi:MAG: LemA family protein, partial [Negativicoccus succinicivorans]|nr:LemA family protein [Negativicoccus succinicivorans]
MANQLDEMNPEFMEEGREVDVIVKQIPVTVTEQERMLPRLLMIAGVIIAVAGWWLDSWMTIGMGAVLAGYPWWALREASSELNMMEQRIQTAASEIDNYMEQRVIILENLVHLLDKSVALDKEVMLEVTKYRSGA